ncbi:MAG: alpha-L-fucosidase [Verrucomicrobia bacterium]|nr:MAG: alpha-L-fucosidase [Verrucomicrobiota bacterium]
MNHRSDCTRIVATVSLFLSAAVAGWGGGAGGAPAGGDAFRYEEDFEQIRAHYRVPDWFRDAKFGIFLHWGPYAVPAYSSEKYPKGIFDPKWQKGGMVPYTYHREHYGDPSVFGYKDFIPMFKAERFDAEAWVRLFKEAGARYVVPVAEHHDGFAMYNSHHTRWNVVNMGPKKDTMRMLADACRKAGLKFGVSSHYALNRIYYKRTDPAWDTNDPRYFDLYWKPVPEDSLPSQEFLDHWWDRTTDIIDQYEPDLIWFDFGFDKPGFEPLHLKTLAYYYNKGLEWGKEVVFQDKNMKYHRFPEDVIVLDIERGRMDQIYPYPWQTDTSVGRISWGYIENEQYKSADYLLDELIDIVSKNGCLLLNIGPKADGTIPAPAEAILREMGAWLKVNGEAIYGTRPWKIHGEGPTRVERGHHSEKRNAEAGPRDIRFTTRGDTLYAIALGWPEDGRFRIESLALGNPWEARPVGQVEYLGGRSTVRWRQADDGLHLAIDAGESGAAAYAFRIHFEPDNGDRTGDEGGATTEKRKGQSR